MNGAESLVKTLIAAEVDVCFANPGTSEMHFVAALDRVDGMRCVLGLFEGVVTGAADGYYRLARKPAATLLHLGPGFANGMANLHNAGKAKSGIVNVVGQHAAYHIKHNSPLTSDVEGIAAPVSDWVRTSADASSVSQDAWDAVAAARSNPGKIATLILPADTAWNAAEAVVKAPFHRTERNVSPDAVREAAKILAGDGKVLLLISGEALTERGLELCARISGKSGCEVMAATYNPIMARGRGRFSVERIPYAVDLAIPILARFEHIILVDAADPVAFFAYPDKPSVLRSRDCQVVTLCSGPDDTLSALEALASDIKAAPVERAASSPTGSVRPTGPLTPASIGQALSCVIPDGAIVVDESLTTGRGFFKPTALAAPHDWLQNMGGSIGFSTPAATGAAIACPDRKVICLVGDGSAMYTLQSLWTQAREKLGVITIVFANRKYQILQGEYEGVGAGQPGLKARDMLSLDNPDLNWVSLANGMGVEAVSVHSVEDLLASIETACRKAGPFLIEVSL